MTGRAVARLLTAGPLIVALMAVAPSVSGADPSLRPVQIQVPAGQLGALLVPVPALITDPGDPRGQVRLDNVSAVAERYRISTSDYILTPDGQPAPAPADYPFGSATWYRFTTNELVLPPGTSTDVPFEIVVPPDAVAGDHFSALTVIVDAAEQAAPTSGSQVRSQLVFQIRLQHRVPGARPEPPRADLEADVGWDTVSFIARLDNDGNTVQSHQAPPFATIDLYPTAPWSSSDGPERTLELKGFYLAPSSQRLIQVPWTGLPIVGSYRAVLTLPATDGAPAITAETSLTVVNVPLVALLVGVLVLLIVLAAFLLIRRRRRRRRAAPSAAGVTGGPGGVPSPPAAHP